MVSASWRSLHENAVFDQYQLYEFKYWLEVEERIYRSEDPGIVRTSVCWVNLKVNKQQGAS